MPRNARNGEKSPASGDLNWIPKVAPWRLAILAKKITRGLAISRMWQIFKLDAQIGPLETGDFGENGDYGLAISRMWQIFKLDNKSGPFKLDN